MTETTALDTAALLDTTGIAPADRVEAAALLAAPASGGTEAVLAFLASRLGSAEDSLPVLGASQADWISAYLRFTPELLRFHEARGIDAAVSRATLADLGRNMAISRRVHGTFGMDTYGWLRHHYAGQLYQLGRLQYLIHQPTLPIPGVEPGEWVAGVHIPEDGGLGADAVGASLAMVRPFFAAHFPGHPVAHANCESWLLDPYLAPRLDPASNIARFAALFTPYGTPRDEPTDAVYFTFRTRSMEDLDALPRETALQRVVLERIDAGGSWQLGFGALALR
ncbi:acyltransferase domain-containing protein [Arthrobacter sp. 35W]|uniref:acyltransferase domain-containing protein n=1 Tax=Arthrobacter sp. 35W TaxID=1132441 RepID=UPI0003F8F798|nr:acyltransferase domain-containing protein [Arthrobacter sp. 35W]